VFFSLKETEKFIVAVRAHALQTQETKQRYNKNSLSIWENWGCDFCCWLSIFLILDSFFLFVLFFSFFMAIGFLMID